MAQKKWEMYYNFYLMVYFSILCSILLFMYSGTFTTHDIWTKFTTGYIELTGKKLGNGCLYYLINHISD
jgi:hypothetical protein